MQKSLAFLIVLFCVVLSFGQKGYADLEFGMSPEQVKQKGYNIKFINNLTEKNVVIYECLAGVSYPVTYRSLGFFDNKLQYVYLTYDISKTGAESAIIEGLKEKYGAKFIKITDVNYWLIVSEDLRIEVTYTKDENYPDIPLLDVIFRGTKIQALYEKAQKEKYQKNLGF